MATFPAVVAPTPDQILWYITHQELGVSSTAVTVTGISSSYRTLWCSLLIVKDASNGTVTMGLNGGGISANYMTETATSTTIADNAGQGQISIPITPSGASLAASRNGQWSLIFLQGIGQRGILIGHGAYLRSSTTAISPVDIFASLSPVPISSISISSGTGSFAAGSALIVTGEDR